MRNFQGTFETPKRSFIGAFSICMTVPYSFYPGFNGCVGKQIDIKKVNFKKCVVIIQARIQGVNQGDLRPPKI